MSRGQQNPRLAALVCLAAFLMMNVISLVHTHGCLDGCGSGCVDSICCPSEQDHCIACDMLLNGGSHAGFASTAAFSIKTGCMWTLDIICSDTPCVPITAGSPRSPPSA